MTWEDVIDFSKGRSMRRISRFTLAGFIICLAVATHWPNQNLALLRQLKSADKAVHFLAYAILTGLLLWAIRESNWNKWKRISWLPLKAVAILAVILLIGTVDELTQPWFHRTCSIWDLFADLLGATLTLSLACVYKLIRGRVLRRLLPYEPLHPL